MRHIGTAGWAIRREFQEAFAAGGSHLTRYAARLNAVEINSSFYRPHRASTYARWAEETPGHFRFSVKLPKQITHERRLADAGDPLAEFLSQCGALGEKLGCILIQLPPSLAFAPSDFFARLRERYDGPAAFEPRHKTWFTPEAEALLARYRIARVAADPPVAGTSPDAIGARDAEPATGKRAPRAPDPPIAGTARDAVGARAGVTHASGASADPTATSAATSRDAGRPAALAAGAAPSIARIAAALCDGGFEYWRLHGSPRIYYSDYDDAFLDALLERTGENAWVIFDNTALGHATRDALALTSAATCRTAPRRASRSR